jgi:hypothetical protein
VALVEIQLRKSSLILEGDGQSTNGMPTGWGYVVAVGDQAADWVKAMPKNALVRLEGVSLVPTIDVSNTSVPKIVPNPEFPAFVFGDPDDPTFDPDYAEHPTILLRNPSYHIVGQKRPVKNERN